MSASLYCPISPVENTHENRRDCINMSVDWRVHEELMHQQNRRRKRLQAGVNERNDLQMLREVGNAFITFKDKYNAARLQWSKIT